MRVICFWGWNDADGRGRRAERMTGAKNLEVMMMKRLLLCLVTLAVGLPPLFAEKLPDGSVIADNLIETKDAAGYVFREPVSLKTPLGELRVRRLNHSGDDFEYYLAEPFPVKTTAGTIHADRISSRFLNLVQHSFELRVGAPSAIAIPELKGVIRADTGDEVTLNRNGGFEEVFIDPVRAKRKFETSAGVFWVSKFFSRRPETGGFRIWFAEPAEIDTGVGKLFFQYEIQFRPDGSVDFGTLARPQSINPKAGEMRIMWIMFNGDGSPSSCILEGRQLLGTKWGILKLTGRVELAADGLVNDGELAEPQDIAFSFGMVKVKDHFNGGSAPFIFRLAQPARIATPLGLLTVNDWFRTYADGSLETFLVTDAPASAIKTAFGEFAVPGGSRIYLYQDGKIASFPIDRPRLITTPAGKIKLGKYLSLFSDGRFAAAEVIDPVTVKTDAGLCRVQGDLAFFPNGKVASCILLGKSVLTTAAGTLTITNSVSFHETGAVKAGRLAARVKVAGVTYPAEYDIELDANGKVTSPPPGH
jgi:hypothetical protein